MRPGEILYCPGTTEAPGEALKTELLDYCKDRIAKHALPQEFGFRMELPKTSAGKVTYRVPEEEAKGLWRLKNVFPNWMQPEDSVFSA